MGLCLKTERSTESWLPTFPQGGARAQPGSQAPRYHLRFTPIPQIVDLSGGTPARGVAAGLELLREVQHREGLFTSARRARLGQPDPTGVSAGANSRIS
jgi:hypothetical protein